MSVPLVFVHGFKGSSLYGPDGDERWLTASQAFNLRTPRLTLPLEFDGDVQRSDGCKAVEPLRQVTPLYKIYDRFLTVAQSLGRPFYSFVYDWRRDLHESCDQFEAFVRQVSERHGGSAVQVVAHSMGGLVTLPVLNRAPHLFHSALFAGVPFRTGIGFLIDLHCGRSTFLNPAIAGPPVLFSFPSVYAFFPTDPHDSKIFDLQDNIVPVDFYDADSWVQNKIGLFSAPSLFSPERASELGKMRQFLAKALERAAHFRTLMVKADIVYPPIAILTAKNRPTLRFLVKDGPRSIHGLDFETKPKYEGDGRVTHFGMAPPEGIPYQEYVSTLEHQSLLSDPRVPEILNELLAAAQRAASVTAGSAHAETEVEKPSVSPEVPGGQVVDY